VRLVQDAELWAAKLDTDVEAIHTLAPGRRAWVQVTRGEVSVDTQLLSAGDGAAVTDQAQVALRSRTPAEILLFDLA
jgi:quercetin 2,3-dioxygenase